MNTNKQRLHAVIHGRVQGVGFRAWTQHHARLLGITGWVRNRHDRTVEVLAQADELTLKQFETLLRQGPNNSRIDQITITWSDVDKTFQDFEIVY